MKILCLLVVFCLQFQHAFAINFVASPSVVLAILLAVFGLLTIRTNKNPYVKSDFLILGLWTLLCISFGCGTMSQTAVNHWIAYTTFIIVIYFGGLRAIDGLIEQKPDFWNKILAMISFMLFIACAYGVIDWVYFLMTGSEIPLPRPEGGGNGMAAGFVRARGFSGEPSGLANFILLWAPLAFWHIFSKKKSTIVKIVFLTVVVCAFLATFSTKGILSVLSSLPFILIFLAVKKGFNPARIVGVSFCVLICCAFILFSGIGDMLYDAVAPKFFGSDIYEARMDRGMNVVDHIEGGHWLVGYGPASYVTLIGHDGETFLSGYAYLLGDAGIIGVAFFLLFLCAQLFFIKKLPYSGLKVVFCVTLYYIATGEIIAPMHYSVGVYLFIILLHAGVINKNRIWRNSIRGLPPFSHTDAVINRSPISTNIKPKTIIHENSPCD